MVSLNMLTWDQLAEGIGKCKFGNGNIKNKVIAKWSEGIAGNELETRMKYFFQNEMTSNLE